MSSSGKAFEGRWKILGWYPLDPSLPDWLVKTVKDGDGAELQIREGANGYEVQWPDKSGGTCTIGSSLTYSGGELVVKSHLAIMDSPEFKPEVIPVVVLLPDTNPQRLIVSLVGGIVEGDPGTFTAEGPPRPDPEG